MDRERRIKEIEKRVMIVGIIDAPGAIMVGLGLYAKFGANGDPFLPILGNENFVNVMLGIGMLIMVWGGYQALKLSREKSRLTREPVL